jgi:hypothetical protein
MPFLSGWFGVLSIKCRPAVCRMSRKSLMLWRAEQELHHDVYYACDADRNLRGRGV